VSDDPKTTVRVEDDGPVRTVILNRPEVRNAVDGPTAEALARAFRVLDADDEVRVAVLWGSGGHFCAGADLKALAEGTGAGTRANRLEEDGDGPMGPTRMRLSKPVIAAVSGYSVAGGMELACWADLRVVEETATFGIFCRRFGVPLIDGGTVRLPRLIGTSRALDLILTGRPVSAQEAFDIGLANRLVPEGTARLHAEALALELARLPQTCLRNDRASVYATEGLEEDEAMRREFRRGMDTVRSGETVAGASRFREGAGRSGGTLEKP
jgi:enoyl-CoA hydratase